MIKFLKYLDLWILFRIYAPLAGWFNERSGKTQFDAAREFSSIAINLWCMAMLVTTILSPSVFGVILLALYVPFMKMVVHPSEKRAIDSFEENQDTPLYLMLWWLRLVWIAITVVTFGPVGKLVNGMFDIGFILMVSSY